MAFIMNIFLRQASPRQKIQPRSEDGAMSGAKNANDTIPGSHLSEMHRGNSLETITNTAVL